MPSYKDELGLVSFESVPHDDGAILYPACDSELALNSPLLSRLEDAIASSQGRVYVSVSSKASIPARVIDRIAQLDHRLRSSRRGFFKVSISFSTKISISEFEPRTSSYEMRLHSLALLRSRDIACSVNLKPLLPVVDLSEYYEIVDDCRPHTDVFLLGGLYLDPASSFGQKMSRSFPHLIRVRRVNWLSHRPLWPCLIDDEQIDSMATYIRVRDAWAFESDANVIDHFTRQCEISDIGLRSATAGS